MILKQNLTFCLNWKHKYNAMFAIIVTTRMWANAQRDGRPAEHNFFYITLHTGGGGGIC